jgi:predicted ATP-grasp superfamily ATP-dependent carboligase
VVVGLDNITGLQTARILAARGIRVFGIAGAASHFGSRTRVCERVIVSPLSGRPLIDAVRDLAGEWPDGVLLPCTDGAVATLSRLRAELPPSLRLPLASDDVVTMLMDKLRFAEHAQRLGLPFPRTVTVASHADVKTAAATVSYPCVVKPAVKTVEWMRRTKAKGFRADSAEDLLRLYDGIETWSPTFVVQEWVEGAESRLFSCNAYFDRYGQPLVTFVARKLRQWPPQVGTSASGEECRNDAVLQETLRLFMGVGFHGLAYLEMKADERTGRLMIIEPNVGRPTGRSAIAEAGGVELVYTAYCDAAGLPLPANRTQRYGRAKWLDMRRDFQAFVVARRNGELTLRGWIASIRGPKAHAIWSSRDPMPFMTDITASVVGEGRKAVRRWRAARGRDG